MPQDKKKQPVDLFDNTSQPRDLFEQEPVDLYTPVSTALQTVQPVLSKISPVFDFLSRPSYASAKFVDSLTDDSKNILDAIVDGFSELVATGAKRQKITYSDVIKRRFPEFSISNPKATSILGFIGDVALDPTTYLGIGTAKNGITLGGRVLTKDVGKSFVEGLETASRKVFIGKNNTIEILEDLGEELTRKGKGIVERTGMKPVSALLPAQGTAITAKGVVSPKLKKQLEALPDTLYEDDLAKLGVASNFNRESFGNTGTVGTLNIDDILLGNRIKKDKLINYTDSILKEGVKRGQKPTPYSLRKQVFEELAEEGVGPEALAKGGEFDKRLEELERLKDQGWKWDIAPIIVSLQQDGTFAALNGNHRIATLKLAGYKGDIPVLFSFREELLEELPNEVALKIFKNQETLLQYKFQRVKDSEIKKGVRLQNVLPPVSELNNLGYFENVAKKQREVGNFFKTIADKPNAPVAKIVAANETLSDLQRFAKLRMTEDLMVDEVRERLEKRILTLAEMKPDLQKKFFEPRGLYLKAGLPFGKQYDIIRLVGLEGIANRVKAITTYIESSSKIGELAVKGGRTIAETFSRDFGLPQEYISMRDQLENDLQYVIGQTVRDTRKLFKNVDQEGRERIGSAMTWVDDRSREYELLSGGGLTDEAYAGIFQSGMSRFKLNDQEQAIASMLQQDFKDAALLEMRANILKSNLVNYFPRGYEVVADPNDMTYITRTKFNPTVGAPTAFLPSGMQRKYITSREAQEAGLNLEMDAALLYAHRIIQSKRALSINQFRDSVEALFGTATQKTTIAKTGILPTTVLSKAIPERVIEDMRAIGEAVYPSGLSNTEKKFINGFDTLQRFFKVGATTIRPGFAAKQLISNTIQSALVSGVRAFKALDPRVAIDAGMLLGFRDRYASKVPDFINNYIGKYMLNTDQILANRVVLSKIVGEDQLTDFAKEFEMTTTLGEKYSGDRLIQLARENGVIRDIDSTGERFSKKVVDELNQTNSLSSVVKELSKVWKHAAMTEDYSRMMLFMNGIRMGKSPREAVKLVNKALFDYQRGLSLVEKNVIRRLIPFYSFPRFAIPFILKQTIKQPGNYVTMEKVNQLVEKLIVTGEELTPSEQNTFGDTFLVDQPRNFKGFDKDGKAVFNILNNLTPFDAINLMVFDKQTGDLDIQRSAEKSFFAAVTPFIKVPIEGLINKNFFTGETIQKAAVLGDLKGSVGTIIPQWAKDLMGYEDRKDLVSGKTRTYISPFLSYYAMQFFPALRNVINGNQDVDFSGSNPVIRAAYTAMNTILDASKVAAQQKVDLKAQYEYALMGMNKEFNDITASIMAARVKGSDSEEKIYQKKLQEFLSILEQNNKLRNPADIKGQGIGKPLGELEGIEDQVQPPTQSPLPQLK